jgi:hypothetical protein
MEYRNRPGRIASNGQDAREMDEMCVRYEARIRYVPLPRRRGDLPAIVNEALLLEFSLGSELVIYRNPYDENVQEEKRQLDELWQQIEAYNGQPRLKGVTIERAMSAFWRNQRLQYCPRWPTSEKERNDERFREFLRKYRRICGKPTPALNRCSHYLQRGTERREKAERKWNETQETMAENMRLSSVNSQYMRALRQLCITEEEAQQYGTQKLMQEIVNLNNGVLFGLEFIAYLHRLATENEDTRARMMAGPTERDEDDGLYKPATGTHIDCSDHPYGLPATTSTSWVDMVLDHENRATQPSHTEVTRGEVIASDQNQPIMASPESEERRVNPSTGAIPKQQTSSARSRPIMADGRSRSSIDMASRAITPRRPALRADRHYYKLACELPAPTPQELIAAAEENLANSPENHPENRCVKYRPVEIQDARHERVRIYPRSVNRGAWDGFFSRWLEMVDDPELGIRIPQAVQYVQNRLQRNAQGIDLVARDRKEAFLLADLINYYGDARYGREGWTDREDWVYPRYPVDEEIEKMVQEIRADRVFELDGRICDPAVLAWERVAATEAELSNTEETEAIAVELGEPVNTSTPNTTLDEAIKEALDGQEIGAEAESRSTDAGVTPMAININWQELGRALMDDPEAMQHICRVMASMGVKGDDKPSQ